MADMASDNAIISTNASPGRAGYLGPDAVPGGRTALVIFIVMAAVLVTDSLEPVWGQVAASLMAWGLLAAIYFRMPRPAQHLLMSCLVVAMLGEVFCSLIWKLYDYRLFNIPAYVPPGHVLIFLLGSSIARRLPRFTVWLVPALVAPYALAGLVIGFDVFGITLYVMFVACLVAERERLLYSTMFMVCMVLEIGGTSLGNWTWRPEAPVWGMSTTNPPMSAGVFYCLLDFLMFRLALSFWSLEGVWRRASFAKIWTLGGLLGELIGQPPGVRLAAQEAKESEAAGE